MNASGNVGKQQGKLTAFVSGSVYRDHRDIVRHDLAHQSRHSGAGVHRDASSTARSRRSRAAATCARSIASRRRTSLSLDGFVLRRPVRRRQLVGLHRSRRAGRRDRPLQPVQVADVDATSRRTTTSRSADRREERAALLDGDRVLDNYATHRTTISRASCMQSDASTPASIRTERDHSVGRTSVRQLEDGLHAAVRRGDEARDGLQAHDAHDDERLRRRLSRSTHRACSTPTPTRATASTITRTSAAATRCCRTRSTSVQTQAGLRLEDAATLLRR